MKDYLEKHGLDADRVETLIDECVQSVVQTMKTWHKKVDPLKLVWSRLLDIVNGRKRDVKVDCSPEEVVATLIRSGVPKENVKAAHNRLDIKLNNATYRIYRGTSGLPSGTFRLINVYNWPCRAENLEDGMLPTEEMTEFIQAFDGLIPDIREKGKVIKSALEEYFFEQKKKEIENAIVRSALADVKETLDQLKIGFHFQTNEDGTISVEFEQYLSANVTASIEEIRNLVNNPEKLQAMMTPGKRQDRRMTVFGGKIRLIP